VHAPLKLIQGLAHSEKDEHFTLKNRYTQTHIHIEKAPEPWLSSLSHG